MVDYRQPPLGYLVRVPQENLDSPLDESARSRAEEAARFLSFQRIGMIVSSKHAAAIETAEIIFQCCGGTFDPLTDERLEDPEQICGYLVHGFPTVVVTTQKGIQGAILPLQPGANVCGEIVGPGGIISAHRVGDEILVRARTMILDFNFTDFVEAANAGS